MMLTPPRVALIPVQMTRLPYCVPYRPNPPTLPTFINASLTGPLTIFPIPRPSDRNENTMELSICPVFCCTVLMIPGQVLVKLPANSPYMKQKMSKGGNEVLNPQIRNTDTTAPTVEMRMAVVTCVRSTIVPIVIEPITAATLIRMTGTVDTVLSNPRALV